MQKQILQAATTLGLVAALTVMFAVAPAAADSFSSIRVDVPFDFTAGHSIFRAGKYTIRPAGWTNSAVIRLISEDGKASAFLSTNSAQSVQSRDVVIFHRYGDQYFLFQVWSGDAIGSEIPKSSMELQAARAIEVNKGRAASSGEPAEIIIAAR